ncbi:RagB/SusD family nutrient uptake outer membrane protein [Sphingobacterium sp. SRCM116780]|uniref:RagB/SusD family nutrient uptake outer membrane protein n=1 Tax=Sphingobacterium sp. SRCM116780 TaxID=2907623 RepID=UPI001F1A6486|nr:RagB/SusD family nutrient uptake outer membrane protein [Sphingobacterium sp. SRCM116780]UIR57819.1 RagB/SusD family nutrient uptake outer membrane protein [Sphingobacterium sp. SRCM116780]
MKKINFIFLLSIICFCTTSCSKDWLEKKQDVKLIIPTTLNDLDMLLNTGFDYDGRGASEISSDEAEYSLDQFNALPYSFQRSLATWNVLQFEQMGANMDEWDIAYKQIQVCNVVLNSLQKISRAHANEILYDRIRGTALYHRSRQFLNLAMTFCKYYDPSTAKSNLGIPLKLSDDIDEPIFRASLEETYQRIVADLQSASTLLPVQKVSYTHIAKGGAYALLARTFLFMDRYSDAKMAADSSYSNHNFIEDYNSVNSSPSRPLNIQSKEMHIPVNPRMALGYPTVARINGELYNSYDVNDLRKILFFKREPDNKFSFRGHYLSALFSGTTTPEVLLISAECNARLGNFSKSMERLNLILEKRFRKGTFVPMQARTKDEALDIILSERRKELLTRCLRWQDLKRLNRDPRYAKTLQRAVGSQVFNLPPNDPRYVLPIPQYIINFNDIEQNKY